MIRGFIGATAFIALLLASPLLAGAQKLKGTVVLIPDPNGELIDATVTFDLPGSAWIAGSWWIIPDRELKGIHTCTIRGIYSAATPIEAAARGNMQIFARLQRGKKLGSVFVAELPRDPETSLFNAGCDGDPSTGDKFQGSFTAIYASPSVYLALALASTRKNPAGLSTEEEIREFFGISALRTRIVPKLIEFHGTELFNRGGSAQGIGSARIALKFLP